MFLVRVEVISDCIVHVTQQNASADRSSIQIKLWLGFNKANRESQLGEIQGERQTSECIILGRFVWLLIVITVA